MPIVSVLMTAYNREKLIVDSIESVLSSTLKDYELIIVDDCSTDNTYEIAKKYEQRDAKVKVYRNENNLGDYNNRNKAAEYATGRYLKYIDSDDVMYSYTLQILVDYMEQYPEAGFGLAAVPPIHKPYPLLLSQRETYLEHFFQYGHFDRSPGSSIVRRDCFERVGGFSGERHIGDIKLWYTLARYYPMLKVPRDLVWVRDHPVTESRREQQHVKQYNILKKKIIDEALHHEDCPLSKEDIKAVYKMLNAKKRKSSIRKIFKRVIGG
jgi:glycosyltransferase involved in cell wall biosynthesis